MAATKPSTPARKPAPTAKAATAVGIRPLADRVLVRRVEEQERLGSGIIVPDSAKEKPQQAVVVAVGSGRALKSGTRIGLTVKAGDQVLIGKWSGTEVKYLGEELLILKEDEILGILG